MKLHASGVGGANTVTAYGAGYISVNGQRHESSLVVLRDQILPWAPRRFDELNELITQHNEWYPVERDLPMNPRTGDYVLVSGRTYRRPVLGPEWVLEHFPAFPHAGA